MATGQTKGRLFNTSAQTANSDLFDSDISTDNDPSNLRVTVSVQSASILNVQETVSGNTVDYDLNGGNALSADELHVFDIPARTDGSYNFQLETGVAIDVLNVDEVRNAEV